MDLLMVKIIRGERVEQILALFIVRGAPRSCELLSFSKDFH